MGRFHSYNVHVASSVKFERNEYELSLAKLSNLQYQFGMSEFELRVEEGQLEEGLDAKAGVLTNFEVLNILRLRGATSDPLGSLGAETSSECQQWELQYPFIQDCETRLQNEGEDLNELEELAKLVVETLPPPPQPPGGEEQ